MSAWLAEFLATLGIAFLNAYLARKDIQLAERQRLVIAQLKLDDEALAFLAEQLGHPSAALVVRLKPGARGNRLS